MNHILYTYVISPIFFVGVIMILTIFRNNDGGSW